MKWVDIKKNFRNQWVLIEVKNVDESFNVLEGEVLAHSKDKDEIYQKLLKIRPKEFSIEYTGKIPEDLAVVMVISERPIQFLITTNNLHAPAFNKQLTTYK